MLRLLTSFVVLAMAGLAISWGWSVAYFAAVEQSATVQERKADSQRGWVGFPGLTGAALSASLTQLSDAADIDGVQRRADELTALLSVRPLASREWLSLAGMRLAAGQPKSSVLAALRMSWITGPNEGTIMWQRGIFGVLIWELLPTEARKRTVRDLVGALAETSISATDLTVARSVLNNSPDETHQEIATMMRAESEAQAVRLGL